MLKTYFSTFKKHVKFSMVISKFRLFHKVCNVEKVWISNPQSGKGEKMLKSCWPQIVFYNFSTSENRINKPFYKFSTVFNICGKLILWRVDFYVDNC